MAKRTAWQKTVRKALLENPTVNVHPEKVICKANGDVEVYEGYFYRHGRSAVLWTAKVVKGLSKVLSLEDMPSSANAEDRWAAWPKDSWFVAILHPPVVAQ